MKIFVRMYVHDSGWPLWQKTYVENTVIDAEQLRVAVSEEILERIKAENGLAVISFELGNITVKVPAHQSNTVYLNGECLNGNTQRLLAGENFLTVGDEGHQLKLVLIACCSI